MEENINEQENVNHVVKSLERKNKKELIEIILRKDAVERTLRKTLDEKDANLDNMEIELNNLTKDCDIIRDKYYIMSKKCNDSIIEARESYDELASVRQEYKDLIKKNKICYSGITLSFIVILMFLIRFLI